MGLILDTSVLIAGERRGETAEALLERLTQAHGEEEAALSAITVVELTHGIYRAKTERDRRRRKGFAEEIFRDLPVQSVTIEIAILAGRIDGEQAALGNTIAFQDLVIGATALFLGFSVGTLNVRHFRQIPGLSVVAMA